MERERAGEVIEGKGRVSEGRKEGGRGDANGEQEGTVSMYLVFAAPPDVSDEAELRLCQVVFGETLVELVHWQVDDLVVGERDRHGPRPLLVPGQVLLRPVTVCVVRQQGHR